MVPFFTSPTPQIILVPPASIPPIKILKRLPILTLLEISLVPVYNILPLLAMGNSWPLRGRVQRVQRVQKVQRVVVSPWRTMSMKSALRNYLSVSYVMISTTVISHLRWLPPPLVPYGTTFPPAERWDNKDPQSNPFISPITISTTCSATTCGGSPAKRARGKPLHERSEAGLFSDARRAVVKVLL